MLFLHTERGFSQAAAGTDSLCMLGNYLSQIQHTVNARQPDEQKIARLDSLIRQGVRYKTVFRRHAKTLFKNGGTDSNHAEQLFHFILQSMVLYKTDLRNKATRPAGTEAAFLNRHIPFFIKTIDAYCEAGIAGYPTGLLFL